MKNKINPLISFFSYKKSVITPGFKLLWIGRTVSLLGDYTFRITLIMFILQKSQDKQMLSQVLAILLLPTICSYLLGGVVGDFTASRKKVMIYLDLMRFFAMASAAYLSIYTDQIWPIIAIALIVSACAGLFEPIGFGFMAEIVPPLKLLQANSAISVGRQIGIIGGPILGSVLINSKGPWLAFAFNSITFLISAFALFSIKSVLSTDRPDSSSKNMYAIFNNMMQGFKYIASVKWLWITLLTATVANAMFTGALDVSVPLILTQNGIIKDFLLGGFYTFQGIGALIGAAALLRIQPENVAKSLFTILAFMSLALAGVGLSGHSIFSLVMAMAYGFGMHWFNSLYPALVQSHVPKSIISRVSSFELLAFDGLMPIGVLVMGALSSWHGSQKSLLAAGIFIASLAIVVGLTSSIRKFTQQS